MTKHNNKRQKSPLRKLGETLGQWALTLGVPLSAFLYLKGPLEEAQNTGPPHCSIQTTNLAHHNYALHSLVTCTDNYVEQAAAENEENVKFPYRDPRVKGKTIFRISDEISIDYLTENNYISAVVSYEHFKNKNGTLTQKRNGKLVKTRIPESVLKGTFMVNEIIGHETDDNTLSLAETMLHMSPPESGDNGSININARNHVKLVSYQAGRIKEQRSEAIGFAQFVGTEAHRSITQSIPNSPWAKISKSYEEQLREKKPWWKSAKTIHKSFFQDPVRQSIAYGLLTQSNCDGLKNQFPQRQQSLRDTYISHFAGLGANIRFIRALQESPSKPAYTIYNNYDANNNLTLSGRKSLAVRANLTTFNRNVKQGPLTDDTGKIVLEQGTNRAIQARIPDENEWRDLDSLRLVFERGKGMSHNTAVSCHYDESAQRRELKLIFTPNAKEQSAIENTSLIAQQKSATQNTRVTPISIALP